MSEVEAYSRLAAVYDEMVVDDAYPQWAAFLHGLWLHDAAGVRSVLDVCCGTGLMAAALIKLGYDVVGIDASAQMLDRARRLLGPDVPLHVVSLPELDVTDRFDAVISTFDGLNYLPPQAFELTLERLSGVLRPGGWLCFDLHSETMMEFTQVNAVVDGESDAKSYVITTRITGRECETTVTITDVTDGDVFTEVHQQYFHRSEDVRRALAIAGFDSVAVVDEYTSAPAGAQTMRDTWIARRT